jgi:hypothetical protein
MNSARARSRTKQKIEELTAKVKEQGTQISNLEQINDKLIKKIRVIETENMMLLQLLLHRGRGGIGDASIPRAVDSAAASGFQLPGPQQPALCRGDPPVGLMALLGKMDKAMLRGGG